MWAGIPSGHLEHFLPRRPKARRSSINDGSQLYLANFRHPSPDPPDGARALPAARQRYYQTRFLGPRFPLSGTPLSLRSRLRLRVTNRSWAVNKATKVTPSHTMAGSKVAALSPRLRLCACAAQQPCGHVGLYCSSICARDLHAAHHARCDAPCRYLAQYIKG